MERFSRGVRVQVFFGEADQVGHAPRHQALLEFLRREGAAGATVVRGVAGFGANSTIHTAAILRLSLDLPIILTWIDAPGRVERLLPGLRALSGSGIITVEEVEIAAYGGRRLEQLRFDLQVRDVMVTPVVSVAAEASVRDAVELLVGREFRALPVVNEAGLLVGVVSNGDLVERGALAARLDLLAAMPATARRRFIDELPARRVAEVMSGDVASVRATDTVATATRLMIERTIKRVPVVDDAGRLVGILARAEVLRAVGETFPRDRDVGTQHPGALTVGEIMRTDAPVVGAEADLATLLDAVVSTRLNRAIVVDAERRVLGVVSDAEVLRSVNPSASAGIVGALMRSAGRVPGGDVRAAQVVARTPVVASPATPIAEAARLMIETHFKVLCVVDDERRLLGIVDRADLLRAAGDALRELAAAATSDDSGSGGD